ncbi:hypothetical protein PHMEG_0009509 [Phytophthora megakarya]|uniref:Reverse transcriptase n=1 Tax=Phytophthora megakarya TaxID=4795 RepID=A0A225WGN2_9STRA|nr:hypothetical protein PHMEG_0009509 [Phytophthora megakarya]
MLDLQCCLVGFFVLMWNLMSRVDSIDMIMFQHMELIDDCLVIEKQGHKYKQTGADKFGMHVSDSKDRYERILRRVVKSLSEEEMCERSCTSEDIGSHSLRTGSNSYALGQVNGPTPVSVYLQMCQSLSKLKDRYIHFGEGADQLCGLMIADLAFDSERFSMLPPHFPSRYLRGILSSNHTIFRSRMFSANPLLQEQRGLAILCDW